MLFLERPVAGACRADHVAHLPAGPRAEVFVSRRHYRKIAIFPKRRTLPAPIAGPLLTNEAAAMTDPFAEALHSDGPNPDLAEKLKLYGR
ncbi:hypothetical protein EOA29_39065, partial [Mesorhizobium sp. M1E.F.Ca.ET.063.01.1.1]